MSARADSPAGTNYPVADYLRRHEEKSLLRFITCGSVDDGKSTLIGRLLYDCHLLFEDQLAALSRDSTRFGAAGAGRLDLALLVDGLQAEREQGITIDVAYRYFSTGRRKFIVADTPGHEQYTRNMVTGASTADLALLLVDCRQGLLAQTRRHAFLASLLGINHVVLAVNKMDLAGYDQAVFRPIADEFTAFAERLGIPHVTCLPVSALEGQNVTQTPTAMPWYQGASLLEHLENVEVDGSALAAPMRLPVQWVCRPNQDFRGYAGTVVGGTLAPGNRVFIAPGGQQTTVSTVVTARGAETAEAGDAVMVTLAEDIDVSRGDVLSLAHDPAGLADQFLAHVAWLGISPLLPERSYIARFGPRQVNLQITALKHRIDVNTLEHLAARSLDMNEVALCNVALDRPVAFDPYRQNRAMGSFIIIDRASNATVGCGIIAHALRRAENVPWQYLEVDKPARAALKAQKPCVVWFTGLSGAGKSTIANLVEKKLLALGRHTYLLDGDNLRHGLNRDLGFTDQDRVENIRRAGECARLMVDAGLIVLAAFISPFAAERRMARSLLDEGEFVEIYVDTPLKTCEARDPKGLYRKARGGELPNMTGIGSPYEPPEHPDLTIRSDGIPPEELAEQIIDYLRKRHMI